MTPDELAQVGLRFEVDGPVATLTLDRPERRNAQTPAMWRAMARLGAEVPDEVRVVVVRGAGVCFSAGLDRTMLDPARSAADGGGDETVVGLLAQDDEAIVRTIGDYQQGFLWLRDPRFVSVAAVHGHAIGAGFQLALSCDLRVVAADAQFSMREAALGLVPDLTGTKPLVEAVGYARALELCTTARTFGAEQAAAYGLTTVDCAADGLDAALEELVGALTAPMAGAVRATKQVVQQASANDLATQCLVERTAQVGRFRELAALAGA
ncbi:enoyl-CoA hydratase/isomerase family protein [Nocardioides perillae]|uniref:Enoyl-CoA hydratase/carnithine racemase n=1 Tax=Nocardioides perillae TaxID=1119534 RepID=A0A7Y9UKW8_9ACTN|nr:enoyl-CoA hydratase/isomerase family protein [Nocardioides perillae]NYG55813.1 enoyl-CoA hydratase/carnithine racemase [Nocardioides perillae]